jgi:MFS family permease
MIRPILPMFITALGGAGLAVGAIGGLMDSISSILKVFCGFWSDRTGRRKPFVFAGYLVSSVFKLFLALSTIWQHVLIFAGLERVGKGLRTAPRDAILAESMPKEKGRGFGLHRALDTSGAVAGAVAVVLLFWFFGFDFKSIILLAATIGFLCLIPLHFVKEKRKEPQNIILKTHLTKLSRPLRLFILISGIFALANFSYMFFILRAQQLFTGKSSIAVPILLYILFNVFYAIFAVPFGILSDKIGRRKVIIFGYALFSLTSFCFAFFNSLIVFVLLFALYGITYAAVDGNQRAYVSDLSSKESRATTLGVFHTTIGLISLPASLIAGFLWQNIAPSTTFIYGGAVSLISVVLFIALTSYFRA